MRRVILLLSHSPYKEPREQLEPGLNERSFSGPAALGRASQLDDSDPDYFGGLISTIDPLPRCPSPIRAYSLRPLVDPGHEQYILPAEGLEACRNNLAARAFAAEAFRPKINRSVICPSCHLAVSGNQSIDTEPTAMLRTDACLAASWALILLAIVPDAAARPQKRSRDAPPGGGSGSGSTSFPPHSTFSAPARRDLQCKSCPYENCLNALVLTNGTDIEYSCYTVGESVNLEQCGQAPQTIA